MGLLQQILGFRGQMQGYRDTARARVLQGMGLDAQSMAQAEYDRRLAQQRQQNAQDLRPLLSRFGAETAGQLGPLLQSQDPQLQAQGGQILQGLLAQLPHSDPRLQLAQDRLKLDQQTEERLAKGDPYAAARLGIAQASEDRKLAAMGRVPVSQMEAMINEESVSAGFEAIANSMKPEYFGFGFDSVAEAATEVKRRTGSDVEFNRFWNTVDSQQAQTRHELFGATLTQGEQAAWNRIAIRPSDAPEVAQAKLKAQAAAIDRKRTIRSKTLQGQGYEAPDVRPPLGSFVTP